MGLGNARSPLAQEPILKPELKEEFPDPEDVLDVKSKDRQDILKRLSEDSPVGNQPLLRIVHGCQIFVGLVWARLA